MSPDVTYENDHDEGGGEVGRGRGQLAHEVVVSSGHNVSVKQKSRYQQNALSLKRSFFSRANIIKFAEFSVYFFKEAFTRAV